MDRILNSFVPLSTEEFMKKIEEIKRMTPSSCCVVPMVIEYDMSGSEFKFLELAKRLLKTIFECSGNEMNKVLFYLLFVISYDGKNYLVRADFADEIKDVDKLLGQLTDCYGPSPLVECTFSADKYIAMITEAFEKASQPIAVSSHMLISSDFVDNCSFGRDEKIRNTTAVEFSKRVNEKEFVMFEIHLDADAKTGEDTFSYNGICCPPDMTSIKGLLHALCVASSSVNVGGNRVKTDRSPEEIKRIIIDQLYAVASRMNLV